MVRALIGHRGFRGPLENTVPAFRRAMKYGMGIEFDVRVTGDGKLVIHHDEGFSLDGNFFRLNELDLREIRRLHPLGKLVTTPKAVFKEFRDAIFDVDVKEPEAVGGILDVIDRMDSHNSLVLSSDDPSIIKTLTREAPDIRVGFSIVGYSSILNLPSLRGLYSIHVPIDVVGYIGRRGFEVLLETFRRRGLRIYLWNYQMNEMVWVPRMAPLVDVVISDDPARLRKVFTF
ncbi:glycerophosphodiester phosphodiesterase family protein [Thermococcus sp.]